LYTHLLQRTSYLELRFGLLLWCPHRNGRHCSTTVKAARPLQSKVTGLATMQKILRINILARNQALKKARANALKEHKKEWREHDFAKLQADRARNRYIKEERTARREDWILGPLAPDRNSGKNKGVYGAVEPVMVRGPSLPTRVRKGPSGNGWDIQGSEGKPDEGKEWEGVGQEGNIVVGDRVCVVKGRDEIRGRIGVVKDVSLERGEVTVEGLNHVCQSLPSWCVRTDKNWDRPISKFPGPLHDRRHKKKSSRL